MKEKNYLDDEQVRKNIEKFNNKEEFYKTANQLDFDNRTITKIPTKKDKEKEPEIEEVTEDERYLKAYINNNYEDFKKGVFNKYHLIFGPIYALYRKQYNQILELIILYIWILLLPMAFLFVIFAEAVSKANTGESSGIILLIIIAVIVALEWISVAITINRAKTFNKKYYHQSQKKVEKIINENKDKKEEEIKKICATSGGTSSVITIIIGLLAIILVILHIPAILELILG